MTGKDAYVLSTSEGEYQISAILLGEDYEFALCPELDRMIETIQVSVPRAEIIMRCKSLILQRVGEAGDRPYAEARLRVEVTGYFGWPMDKQFARTNRVLSTGSSKQCQEWWEADQLHF